MHPRHLCPLALVSLLPVHAQDTLEGALKNVRPGDYTLLIRAEDASAFAAQWDEDALRLRLDGQLYRTVLGPQTAAKLWKAHGWGNEIGWILVDGRGTELDAGTGAFYGTRALAVLRDRGLVPRWEARRAFLKEHPENGEAWSEEVFRCLRIARLHMNALARQGRAVWGGATIMNAIGGLTLTEPDPEARGRLADPIFGELAAALEGATSVADWWRSESDPSILLVIAGAQESPRMRDVCSRLAADLGEAYTRSEGGYALESRLAHFRAAAGRPLRELPDRVALPDQDPLSPMLFLACLGTLEVAEDWEGMLAFLDNPALLEEGEVRSTAAWESRCGSRSLIAAFKVRPLLELGRTREAREAIADARSWAGEKYQGTSVELILGRNVKDQALLKEALEEPVRPRPPMPPLPPAPRLALLGAPAWLKDWEALRGSETLLPWSRAELAWTTLAPAEAEALRARMGWGSEPRWVLLLGEESVASGTRCPVPGLLAGILERERPSALQRLDRILERHPGHLGARRARMALLKTRMPEPRLERVLAEDARAAFQPADFGFQDYPLDFGPDAPWKPDPALWQWSAQQVLPRLETLLRSWPNQQAVWKAWLAWARFHPDRPSVVAFSGTLTLWTSRERWMGGLPLEVLRAVTEELRRDRNYPELVRWLGAAWRARLEEHRNTTTTMVDERRKNWEALGPALVTPLAEMLRLTARPDQAREVETTYRDMLAR